MLLLRHLLVIGLMEAITSVSRRSKALRSTKLIYFILNVLIKFIEHMYLGFIILFSIPTKL